LQEEEIIHTRDRDLDPISASDSSAMIPNPYILRARVRETIDRHPETA
jgi:hypothetical protein